ncbi:MAG: isoleucine--tRNA ligase [Planctomycetota bacterium]|nr:MAG: isoleucine--tRNA ligase [Planctomycetota bacterium]
MSAPTSQSAAAAAPARSYPSVEAAPDYPKLEERVLAHWRERDLFRRSVEQRPAGERGANEYVFYDGPPFANGLPHYGHLLTGYVKDAVPRYQTLRGRRVERRFGWDCHGLPAEMEAEKQLGISGRAKIQEYGIERFNAHCKSSVMRYTGEWQRYVTRQARWVDFERDYKTMDLSYMESVMWAFKRLHDKGLVYEGFRVMPYSWAAETPVSNFETRIDNSYRPRQDPAVTVKFALAPRAGDGAPLVLLAWTTTPWTLPSNLALAVGPEVEYAIFELATASGGERWVLAAAAAARYEKELAGAARVGTLKGAELVGRAYTPLFPYFAKHPNAFKVLAGDFVSTEDGTGIVHMAPGFGEDDQRVCAANGIDVVVPVDGQGKFTAEVPDWQGQNVLEANKPILQHLKQRGVVVRHETIVHNYPHCWRTDQPLIYRALSSWYVKVTDFRERMVELNRSIRWIPEHVRDGQFGKWLEGARDWSISRNRFWGSPIPVWKSPSGKIKVFGSIAELEQASGKQVTDLHRPFVDELVIQDGGEEYRRVEDVLDCWFESGSMPFAQVHYPFENKEWFEQHSPADFIVEYVAQTRGWFYTLMVLGTALFDRPPFQTCVCHGVVLDENGQKLSKKLRNYPDPEEVFRTIGSDALRWFLLSSPIVRGADLQIDKEGKAIGEVVRLVLNPIWNAYYFFTLYANADGFRGRLRADQQGVLDRYVLCKLRATLEQTTVSMDACDLTGACAHIRGFLDALNNWWIRRSRERFWAAVTGDAARDRDKQDAYDTLYTCLHVLCRMASPLLPLLSEEVYRGLTGEESVHLTDWPDASTLPQDAALVADMDRVREVCSVALGLRDEHKKRVRLPLREIVVAGKDTGRLARYAELVQDELNVKQVAVEPRFDEFATLRLDVNARVLGKRRPADMKNVLAAAKAGEFRTVGDAIEVAGVALEKEEYTLKLAARTGLDGRAVQGLASNDAVVVLDVRTTPELEREGLARDLVRAIQQARKDAGLHVSDSIELWIDAPADVQAAYDAHASYVNEQVLARRVHSGAAPTGAKTSAAELEGRKVALGVQKSR